MAGFRLELDCSLCLARRALAIAGLAAAVCIAAGSSALGQDKWLTSVEQDPMTDEKNVIGFLEHDFKQGGKVDVTGQCDSDSMTMKFEYHAKSRSETYYNTQGTSEVVHLQYRLDGGSANLVISNTQFTNEADINFVFQPPEDDDTPNTSRSSLDSSLAKVSARLYLGLAPQDLRKLLHAKRMLVELPLGGKQPDYVEINLLDTGFKRFVSLCKIDVGKVDSELAKRQAEREAKKVAARNADSAVADICSKGGTMEIKVAGGVSDNPNGYVRYAALKRGQLVTVNANSEAIRNRMCSVSATNSIGTEITGLVSFDLFETTEKPWDYWLSRK